LNTVTTVRAKLAILLATRPPVVNGPPQTDNVWDIDCSHFFADDESDIHGAYFKLDQYAAIKTLIREVLRGADRGVLVNRNIAASNSWWPNKLP
jgi:hypothetical protein